MLTTADITKLKEIFVTKDELRFELKELTKTLTTTLTERLTKTITGTIIGELTEIITITSNGLQNEIDEFREEMRDITTNHELRLDRLEDTVYS